MGKVMISVSGKRAKGKAVRVLHVLSSLAIQNGMLSVIESYHRHLDPKEVTFDYVYFYELPDNRKEEIEGTGSRTFYVPFQDSARPFHVLESFFAEHDGEWDILHCHPPFAPQLYARAAKRHGVQRIIAHSHSTSFSDKKLSALRNWTLSRFLGFFATDYITCSNAARVLLGRYGEQALLLRNAIECDRFAYNPKERAAVRSELCISDEVTLLGSVGRLATQKNQCYMLSILKELKKDGLPCKLAIAGSGPKEQELRKKAIEYGVEDDLLLLGRRADAPRLYSAFDIYLLTSLFEGLPISLIEAQTSGLPCFVSDRVTDEARIINTQFLSIEGQPSDWAEAIVNYNREDIDRNTAANEVKKSGYDVLIEAKRLQEFYKTLVPRGDAI